MCSIRKYICTVYCVVYSFIFSYFKLKKLKILINKNVDISIKKILDLESEYNHLESEFKDTII